LQVGDTAPDFALESLSGETLRLSDMRGQAVMINFWAVWCGYCRIELPAMQAVYQVYQDQEFVVLAVDVQESRDLVEAFVEDAGLTFPILLDQRAEVTSLYRIRGLPTSYFVDRDGVITAVHLGPVNEQLIEEYMAEAGVQ
jgi:peroxiredoxin